MNARRQPGPEGDLFRPVSSPGDSARPLLRLTDLRLTITGDDGRDRPVLRGLDLTVEAGEAVGLVGESGSGKSMTLRAIARLTPPTATVTGEVLVGGLDVHRLRGKDLRRFRQTDVGYVFQDSRAAINPLHTVGDFLLEVARDRGEDEATARTAALDVLGRMGVTDPERRMRQYPFELSGGLLQRVMIASVLMARPSLLLADEPTTALDVTTQSEVLALTDELRRDRGIAMLFVTHDLDLALAVCARIVVLYAGQVLELAGSDVLRHRPLHPYTRGLLASRPPLETRLDRIPVIPGTPISAADAGPGCPFAGRCIVALPRCTDQPAPIYPYEGGQVACHRAAELAAGELDDVLPPPSAVPASPLSNGRSDGGDRG